MSNIKKVYDPKLLCKLIRRREKTVQYYRYLAESEEELKKELVELGKQPLSDRDAAIHYSHVEARLSDLPATLEHFYKESLKLDLEINDILQVAPFGNVNI